MRDVVVDEVVTYQVVNRALKVPKDAWGFLNTPPPPAHPVVFCQSHSERSIRARSGAGAAVQPHPRRNIR